jgi:hypothetical protein
VISTLAQAYSDSACGLVWCYEGALFNLVSRRCSQHSSLDFRRAPSGRVISKCSRFACAVARCASPLLRAGNLTHDRRKHLTYELRIETILSGATRCATLLPESLRVRPVGFRLSFGEQDEIYGQCQDIAREYLLRSWGYSGEFQLYHGWGMATKRI